MDNALLGPDGCSPAAILTLEFKYIFLTRAEICVCMYIEKSKSYHKHIFFRHQCSSIYTYENGSNQILGEMYIVGS